MQKLVQFLLKPLNIVMLVIILGSLGLAGYLYWQNQNAQEQIRAVASDPNKLKEASKLENQRLVEEVGKVVVLPTGEEPAVATVTDAGKLKEQPFFAKAKNGYKVLIFTKAKRAVLYDPENKKVVELAPINLGDNQSATDSGAANTQTKTDSSQGQ